MIMILSHLCEVGKTYEGEFHEPSTIYTDVRIHILRTATLEEWVQDRVEAGYDEASARSHAMRRQALGWTFYKVSVD